MAYDHAEWHASVLAVLNHLVPLPKSVNQGFPTHGLPMSFVQPMYIFL